MAAEKAISATLSAGFLGEQSTRVLRCSRMEDVVFSGTPTRRAQGYAEVTLTIDNSMRQLAFDDDLVSITRRYYRSGDSEYLINKAAVRLKDIHELLWIPAWAGMVIPLLGRVKLTALWRHVRRQAGDI